MSDEYTADIVTLQDEDGNEFDFEIIDQLEYDSNEYVALVPCEDEEDISDDEVPFIIMRTAYDEGEEFLDIVDNEDELSTVIAMFEERLSEDYEIDSEE